MKYTLRRTDLHGLPAYLVISPAGTHLGYVVRKSEGRTWAIRRLDDDTYEPLEYWFSTRKEALRCLLEEWK